MSYSSPPCFAHELDSTFTLVSARDLQIKRIYDTPMPSDGFRVLVDRLWPRGISKKRAALNGWLRDLAPSTALRQWYAHDPERWPEFRRRYRAELAQKAPLVEAIRHRALDERVTLLYAAEDTAHSHALVLKQFIEAA